MPEELMIVLVVFMTVVALPLGLTRMFLSHKQKKMAIESNQNDSSLTEGELRSLISSAVSDATVDINNRLDLIQDELDEVVLQKLTVGEKIESEQSQKSVGRRVR